MLDANPHLGWRDVKTILAMSSETLSIAGSVVNGANDWNGGGMTLVKTPAELEPMAAKYGRPFFQGTGMAMYNEQEPARADPCGADKNHS